MKNKEKPGSETYHTLGIYGAWALEIEGEIDWYRPFPAWKDDGKREDDEKQRLRVVDVRAGEYDDPDELDPRWIHYVRSLGANYIMVGQGKRTDVYELPLCEKRERKRICHPDIMEMQLKEVCQHDDTEDCMLCSSCGKCSEDLDETELCEDCRNIKVRVCVDKPNKKNEEKVECHECGIDLAVTLPVYIQSIIREGRGDRFSPQPNAGQEWIGSFYFYCPRCQANNSFPAME